MRITQTRKPVLELVEDPHFEQLEWKLQRIAWFLMAVVAFLGVLGLFGVGPLNSVTPFDLVLLLIINEAAQNAMIGQDYSLTNSFLVILTIVGLDILLSFVKQRSHRAEKILDGSPLLIVEHGRLLEDRMHKSRVDQEDVMAAARQHQGMERLEQIKYAVLEVNGDISIIPEKGVR